jgi:hypothetical protein
MAPDEETISGATAPAPSLTSRPSGDDLVMADMPVDEVGLRRQWELQGRPPCENPGCPNRAHPPPCDPESRDRIRAQRAEAKALKKAEKAEKAATQPAKFVEVLAKPPGQTSMKREASTDWAGSDAKRHQPAMVGVADNTTATYGSAIALANSANSADRNFAQDALRHLEARMRDFSAPPRENAARDAASLGNNTSSGPTNYRASPPKRWRR